MKKSPPPVHQIELRIVELAELFNSMGPTPFHLTHNAFLRVLKESLVIGGWVAMWRPMVRRGRIYSSLGRASVHVAPWKA